MSYNFININNKESGSFEILKLTLLLQVVLGHAIALSLPQMSELNTNTGGGIALMLFKACFSFGRESAYLFIFLSGFFTGNVFLSDTKPFSWFEVNKKRIIRIYPVFTIALLFTLFFDFIGMNVFRFLVYKNNSLNYIVEDYFSFNLFIKNFLSLQPTFSLTFGSNGPLWTLGYLIQFYLLVTLVRKISGASFSRFFFVFILFLFLTWPLVGTEFSLLLFVWYSGVLLRWVNLKSINFNILFLLLFIVMLLFISKVSQKYISMLLTPINGILHFIKKVPNVFYGIKLSNFPKLPDISYSLYAVHMPILFIVYGLFTYYFGKEFMNIYYVIYIIISLALSILVSIAILRVLTVKSGRGE
jgi:peptidoglycan/LPS O-acetylase OafA/YrhL